jgi:hypothetical protein
VKQDASALQGVFVGLQLPSCHDRFTAVHSAHVVMTDGAAVTEHLFGPEITPRTVNLLMVCVAGYRFSQQPTEPAACSVVRNEKCVQSALAAHRAWHSAAVCALESVEMSFPFVLPKLMSASKHRPGTSAGAAVEGAGGGVGDLQHSASYLAMASEQMDLSKSWLILSPPSIGPSMKPQVFPIPLSP